MRGPYPHPGCHVQNDTQELSRALESHLSRYKQTVEEVQRLHPDYFTDGLEP